MAVQKVYEVAPQKFYSTVAKNVSWIFRCQLGAKKETTSGQNKISLLLIISHTQTPTICWSVSEHSSADKHI